MPTYARPMRDIDTIDSELQLVAGLCRADRERGGPLPTIDVADARLDERRELATRLLVLSHRSWRVAPPSSNHAMITSR